MDLEDSTGGVITEMEALLWTWMALLVHSTVDLEDSTVDLEELY